MTKATKSLLTASIVFVLPGSLFTSGLVNVENLPALYVLLPTGVVFLGLALWGADRFAETGRGASTITSGVFTKLGTWLKEFF